MIPTNFQTSEFSYFIYRIRTTILREMAASVGVANSNNMYRVGDYVFFENSASGPYAVRRIEELNKTASGRQ